MIPIYKKTVYLFLVIPLLLTLPACGMYGTRKSETYSLTNESAVSTTERSAAETTAKQTDAAQSTRSDTASATKSSQKEETTKAPSETTTSKYNTDATAMFSEDADNAFIKAVVDKYGVDPALLVACYTVPQSDGNFVLQFNGTKDSQGKYIRNGNTLKYIYTIDASYNIKRAGENPLEDNDYSTSESVMMFYSIRKWLIPKYEAELSK